jgi:hypothetical protein
MTRPIHDYELQNVIEMTQQYIDERVGRLKNIDNLVASKDFENLSNAIFGALTMFYMCRYCLIIMDVVAMEGPNPDLYTRSKKTTELSNEFKARYQEALKKYKEFTPSEVGQTKSDEQLKTIHRLASENFGSKKFDLDIDIEFT